MPGDEGGTSISMPWLMIMYQLIHNMAPVNAPYRTGHASRPAAEAGENTDDDRADRED